MKNNKGFSLIELIVVVAIMSVLVGMIGVGISVVINRRVSTAASNTKEILQAAQQVAMSKNDSFVEISVDSNGTTIVKAKSDTNKVFETFEVDDKIQVYAILSGTTNPVAVNSSNTLEIKWDRASGAFDKCVYGTDSSQYCDGLQFVKGDKTVTLDFARQTGRVTVR